MAEARPDGAYLEVRDGKVVCDVVVDGSTRRLNMSATYAANLGAGLLAAASKVMNADSNVVPLVPRG